MTLEIKPIKNGAVTTFAVETLLLQPGIPATVKRAFENTLGQMTSGDQLMWREVAARMTLDAFGHTPEVINVRDGMEARRFNYYRTTVNQARTWFLQKKHREDVEQVFDMCGADLASVLEEVQKLPPIQEPAFVSTKRKGGGLVMKTTAAAQPCRT